MKKLSLLLVLAATPAAAATGPFFSLRNTDFVVTLAFLLFVAVLFYFKVPSLLGGLLDKRASAIKSELDEARSIREEAQTLLASYERKHKEVQELADKIVETAKREATDAAEQAKADLKASIARRLAAAEDQIASAEAAAVREVRDRAIAVATQAAGDVVAKQLGAAEKAALIEGAISEVSAKLH
ncbi:F0F1 ATP synthase subunit B [Ostreiculturibacter nitratireducens]|uniref:F0F1 ATP synthase subunit B n=1 Tax=Ostreiculturibacter nitratireducens TaxID=3075226 RepID=UPI0031B6488F